MSKGFARSGKARPDAGGNGCSDSADVQDGSASRARRAATPRAGARLAVGPRRFGDGDLADEGTFARSARAMSLVVAPASNSPLRMRSTVTVGSPASIFATRDWLEPIRRANASCESPSAARSERRGLGTERDVGERWHGGRIGGSSTTSTPGSSRPRISYACSRARTSCR